VILKDQMDDTVKSVDMARHFGLPILAVIPRIEDPQQIAAEAVKDRKIYIAAGAYFSLILAVLALELLGINILVKLKDVISG
jgi:hypothetical protein